MLVANIEDDEGNAVADHLEVTLTNTGATDLDGFEVYYTISDPTMGEAESYYAELPADFTIAPGARHVAHFETRANLRRQRVQPLLHRHQCP